MNRLLKKPLARQNQLARKLAESVMKITNCYFHYNDAHNIKDSFNY
jgi:hypothetical protein